jgi:8-oxo-dGTP pyrophosphatase MutT (NUDIX family)
MSLPLQLALEKISVSELAYRALSKSPYERPKNLSVAAVCVLFRGNTFEDAEVLLTQRTSLVHTHQAQVAFPGGSEDPADQGDLKVTALRECEEEVGLPRSALQAIGLIPSAFTLSGMFEVTPVICMIENSLSNLLKTEPAEVEIAEWVKVSTLQKSFYLEDRIIQGVEIKAPVFMWGERKMWGLSAWIFDLILSRYDTLLK